LGGPGKKKRVWGEMTGMGDPIRKKYERCYSSSRVYEKKGRKREIAGGEAASSPWGGVVKNSAVNERARKKKKGGEASEQIKQGFATWTGKTAELTPS